MAFENIYATVKEITDYKEGRKKEENQVNSS